MSYTRKIFYSSVFLFVSNLLISFLGYFHRYLLSQKLSVNDFGLFYIVIGFFGFFGMFTSLGLDGVMHRYATEYYVRKEKNNIDFLITFIMLFKFILSLFLIIILYVNQEFIILNYFKDERLEYFFYIMYLIILVSPFYTVASILLNSFMKFKYLAILNILYWCCVVFFTYMSVNIHGLLMSYYIPFLFIWLIAGLILFYVIKYKIVYVFDIKLIKEYFKYSVPSFLAVLAFNILGYQDIAFLTFFATNNDVGVYSMGMAIASIIWSLSNSFVLVFFPYFIEIKNKDIGLFINGVQRIFKYTIIIFMPLIFLFFVFGYLFVNLLFGSKYILAVPILQICILGFLFVIFFNICNTIINSVLHPRYVIKYIYISILSGVVLNLVFIQYYGAIAAATVFVFIYFMLFIFAYNVIKEKLNIYFQYRYVFISFVIAVILGFVAYYLNSILLFNSYVKGVVLFIFYYVVYIYVLFVFKVIKKDEIIQFYKQIKYSP